MPPGDVTSRSDLKQAVRDAVDIVDIASEMTSLKRAGRRYQGLCPFHKEKTPSFSVDPDSGLYYCFGCGAGGDAIGLYMASSGDDFPAALEALARRYGIPLPAAPVGGPRQRDERKEVTNALEAAQTFFTRQLAKSSFASDYLAKRDISPELIERYGLGYAPDDWRQLLQALQGRIPIADLIAAGLVGRSSKSGDPYDRFRHRLMFPIHAPNGRLVGFGGRTLGDDKAKYVNTAETAEFHKSRLLYGFHQAKRSLRDGGRAFLVEGYFDVIGAVASGVDYAVAGMGTSLTQEQSALLKRYVDEVVVGFDGDAAGEKAFQRGLPILLGSGLHVRRALFPSGHDPDSLRQEAGPDAVRQLVEAAPDGTWLELERLLPPPDQRSPAELTRAARAMVEVLRPIRDRIMRTEYTKHAAEVLGVPENLFHQRLGPTLFYDPERAERAQEVRPIEGEERAIQLLLQPGAVIPNPLPTEEIFLDSVCRNIFAAFCALYRDGGERPPTVEKLLARLDSESEAIDRIARLLLEDSSSGEDDLENVLSRLVRRWRKQRQGELMRQIQQALERGEKARLTELLEEKKDLNRRLHPGMDGRWW